MNTSIQAVPLARLVTGFGIFLLSACASQDKKTAATPTDKAITVTVATPSATQSSAIRLSGQVEAVQSANISTRVMGYLTSVLVKVGDRVSKGQLLATVGNEDIMAKKATANAMIAEAEAACKNAQKDVDRFTSLYRQQSATAKELENVQLQYSAAASRLEQARQMRNEINATLTYTRLTAPFSGVVSRKLMDAGSMATPGMPILEIENSGSYQVNVAVPESQIASIAAGKTAVIYLEAAGKTIKGQVSQVSPSSRFTDGQYLVKITIPDTEKQGVLAGMYATVTISVTDTAVRNRNQVLVPLTAIVEKDQLTGIYTVASDNTALLRWITPGKTTGSEVEVLSGLGADEQFIVKASGQLYDGAPVILKK